MAEEPTLPTLPKVSWDSQTQSFVNTRKRNRDDATPQPVFSNSSDPAVFSSDDDPHVDNYVNGRHRKKRYVGSWFQQMPTSSDSTFGEAVGPRPKPNRTFERQWDSGVWMGSDGSVELDEDEGFDMEVEPSLESKLPQLRNSCLVPPVAPEELTVRARIEAAIEDGNPDIDLSYAIPFAQAKLDKRLAQ
ncbi:putative leucine rich repeat domain protein [Rosellinia necatrix]|uniref:Putative leucine rich repeat domain protein n=1 Tax=Rosellinia necatrix TaxID=77044 RepID=A0A1W2TEY3_ROSNE|nr:putative leucine rich repeat domain protein [Rosellinia necatrix]